MDFLRLLSDDLQLLRAETKRKYPVVKEAVDKALETLPYLQKQYAALLSVETAPGPGHPLFKCESILRPFLLACNHTNASHKVLILALTSIQRLVSWDAIEPASVGSILRVLQIQAEKNAHGDVQVKLLQTLLQLVTLGFEDKARRTARTAADDDTDDELDATAAAVTTAVSATTTTAEGSTTTTTTTTTTTAGSATTTSATIDSALESALVGNEDLVMQALWICLHLHGSSGGANSVVGNTAAMTIRQVVSLAFGKVGCSVEAKRVGVLVFQELCFLGRDESGVMLRRSATSAMTVALGVELLETVLTAHAALFRGDAEFRAVLKQHVPSLLQSVLEMGCAPSLSLSSLSSLSSSGSSTPTALALGGALTLTGNAVGFAAPFFPLLVRVMRLTSVLLCHFTDVLADECAFAVHALLEIITTGSYHAPTAPSQSQSPGPGHLATSDSGKIQPGFTLGAGSGGLLSNAIANAIAPSGNHVTWPVLLALEVLNRMASEAKMIVAIAQYDDEVLPAVVRTVASVVTTSPPQDFRLPSADSTFTGRSGLEFLNDQDAPPLQPFFAAIRVSVHLHSLLIGAVFDLSRELKDDDVQQGELLASKAVAVIAPLAVHTFTCTLRHGREVELVQLALKSYHVLATTASRLRAITTASPDTSTDTVPKMNDVVLASLRALCIFAFPLPDGGKSASSKLGGVASSSAGSASNLEHHAEEGTDAEVTDSGIVIISWREVHAMKALFSAAHLMEEDLLESEWCVLLSAFQLIVGLTDVKLKSGQYKLPTRAYRLNAIRVEDEDVEQQLVMLGNSIIELFRDALQLSSPALRRLTAALQIVCWDQLGLQHPPMKGKEIAPPPPVLATDAPASGSSEHSDLELPQVSAAYQLKTYENFLGVGLSGTNAFIPSFPLRMLTQLASNSKHCFEDVMQELVLMSTYDVRPPATAAQFPQLSQLQVFCTDSILRLLQNALLSAINSFSPTAKSQNNAPTQPYIFDQEELFRPLLPLMRSDMKERALVGLLELLNTCGHLLHTGWPLALAAVQEALEVGDGKAQTAAFKCLRVIVDDLVAGMPRAYLPHCVKCIERVACCAKDVNISLTAINELWSVADIFGKRTTSNAATTTTSHWGCAFAAFGEVALDDRAEVRNSAINTLFSAGVTYGVQFGLEEWQLFVDKTVLPLAETLYKGRAMLSTTVGDDEIVRDGVTTAQRQWDESRVLMLVGLSRVLQTNCAGLLKHREWFTSTWRKILAHVALNVEHGHAKDVVLAGIQTLQTLLQVASSRDFEQLAQAQPLRAGAGMRVVGGALVAASAPSKTSGTTTPQSSSASPGVCRDPVLWEEAFVELLQMCDARVHEVDPSEWHEEDEQDIAGAVVVAAMTLFTNGQDVEFRDGKNVLRLLDLFETLIQRHVGSVNARPRVKGVSTITTNSVQARVLAALEECGAFPGHVDVHVKALRLVVSFVRPSQVPDLIFFTRHALISLGKLYANVSVDARRACFDMVLACLQPFVVVSLEDAESPVISNSPNAPPLTAAQKAISQQWKHALGVLLALTSQGLAAVQLTDGPWQRLFEMITLVVGAHNGEFPPYVHDEEDETLVLSLIEMLVASVLTLLGNPAGIPVATAESTQYEALLGSVLNLLRSSTDAPKFCHSQLRACVRQLSILAMQPQDAHLATLARKTLVQCCTSALQTFAAVEENAATSMSESAVSAASVAQAAEVLAARDRVVLLLSHACEVSLRPRLVLEMFDAMCRCIASSDAEVRRQIQHLLLQARLPQVYGNADDGMDHNR